MLNYRLHGIIVTAPALPSVLANQSLFDLKFLGFISMPVTDVYGNLFAIPVKRTTAGELFGFQQIVKIGRYLLGLCYRDKVLD